MPLAVSVVTDGTDCQRAVVWYPPWHHHPLLAPPERSPCILRKEEAFPQVNVSVPGQNKLFFRIAFILFSFFDNGGSRLYMYSDYNIA